MGRGAFGRIPRTCRCCSLARWNGRAVNARPGRGRAGCAAP